MDSTKTLNEFCINLEKFAKNTDHLPSAVLSEMEDNN